MPLWTKAPDRHGAVRNVASPCVSVCSSVALHALVCFVKKSSSARCPASHWNVCERSELLRLIHFTSPTVLRDETPSGCGLSCSIVLGIGFLTFVGGHREGSVFHVCVFSRTRTEQRSSRSYSLRDFVATLFSDGVCLRRRGSRQVSRC